MEHHMKIPQITILGVTATACADPIIGTWNLNEVCFSEDGNQQCQTFPIEEYGSSSSLEMIIEDDLTGEIKQISTGEYNQTYTFPLTVEKEANRNYKITIRESEASNTEMVNFDCSLEPESLRCLTTMEGMSVDYRYEKQQ